jgi:hypothetical protein
MSTLPRLQFWCGDGTMVTEQPGKDSGLVSCGMVNKWCSRFLKLRLEWLYGEPQPGVPRQVSDARVEEHSGEHAARPDTLEHAWHGASERARPHDNQADLVRLRLVPSSHRNLQTVARLLAHRESAAHRGSVFEPARSRPGHVRGPGKPDLDAGPRAAAAAHAAGANRTPCQSASAMGRLLCMQPWKRRRAGCRSRCLLSPKDSKLGLNSLILRYIHSGLFRPTDFQPVALPP